MDDSIDWKLTTWEGNRLRQHREFQALPFRDKLKLIEQMSEVADFFENARRLRHQVGAAPGEES